MTREEALQRRHDFIEGWYAGIPARRGEAGVEAKRRYPITEIRPREVTDSEGLTWRVTTDRELSFRPLGSDSWFCSLHLPGSRREVLADLLARPTEEVQGDE